MGRRSSLANEFEEELRTVRHQTLTHKNNKLKTPIKKETTKTERAIKKREKARDILISKLDDYENEVPNFTNDDLIQYFMYLYETTNNKNYFVSWAKDRTVMTRLKEVFDTLDVCLMMEFLFNSDQTYLDKRSIGIGVIGSGWANKIHTDSILWSEDNYDDSSRYKNKKSDERESSWNTNDNSTSNVEIGEW